MKIIIHCDDLGASAEVNKSIFSLLDQRRVTSASLLMNAPAVEAAIMRLPDYPNASFGVHLNISEFSPLTTHPGLIPLINHDGQFSERTRQTPLTSSVRQGVFAEWCTQVERALKLGVPVSHLDSHHHVHTLPCLFGVLKRVQKEFGIRRVRLTRNVVSSSESMRATLRASKVLWNFMLRHYYRTATTDGFTSFSTFHERLQAGLGWRGTIELMCHPGSELFRPETELLHGPWWEEVKKDAQLISYNEL